MKRKRLWNSFLDPKSKNKKVKSVKWNVVDSDGWVQTAIDTWHNIIEPNTPRAQVAFWAADELPRSNGNREKLSVEGYYASKVGIPHWVGPFTSLETAKNVALYLNQEEQ